jgi:hypothetical protein
MFMSMNYGEMPSREEYDLAWEQAVDRNKFRFGNDKRIGDDALSQDELWDELQKAHLEFKAARNPTEIDTVGDWLSSVLYCLGIEWV